MLFFFIFFAYAAVTLTRSPRVFQVWPIWDKRQKLRWTFNVLLDVDEYGRRYGKDYSELMADIKSLHDTTPSALTMTVAGWTNTHSVRVLAPRADPEEGLKPLHMGDPIMRLETVL